MAVNVPNEEIFAAADRLAFILLIIGILGLIVSIILVWFVGYGLTQQIQHIQKVLSDFFAFLNHEEITITTRPARYNDELGKMITAINSNIAHVQETTQQDKAAIESSIRAVEIVKSGNLSVRIETNRETQSSNSSKICWTICLMYCKQK